MLIDNSMFQNDNHLNCSNFQVNTDEGYFYLDNGYRSLWRLSKKINVPFKELCLNLMSEGQVTFKYLEDDSTASVTRI